MDLIMLVLVVALVGFLVYLLTTYVPMPPVLKTALQVFVVIVLVLYVLTRIVHLPNVLP